MSMSNLAAVAEQLNGRLIGKDQVFNSVSTDTRTIEPGELFFALRGERFDAGEFVAKAAESGAAGAVVDTEQAVELSQVTVADTRTALAEYAAAWRQQFSVPLVGITGSNGKTTMKEMIASILRVWVGNDNTVLTTRNN